MKVRRIPELESLRGLMALWVMLGHIYLTLPRADLVAGVGAAGRGIKEERADLGEVGGAEPIERVERAARDETAGLRHDAGLGQVRRSGDQRDAAELTRGRRGRRHRQCRVRFRCCDRRRFR